MPARLATAIRAFVAPVLGDRRGVAAVFLAVALIPMLAAVGLAIDSSLGYLLKARISKSLDAAGLAAGRKALDADAEAIARTYFDANFGTNLGDIEVTDFDFELDDEQHYVTLRAEATAPTYFMRIFGHRQMTVSARTVIERQTTGMELALVLDNTGSMYGANFDAMKAAADDLIEIVFGEENEIDNVWVSLVPYVAAVNVGPTRTGWLAAGDDVLTHPERFGTSADGAGYGWKGCVMARAYPWDSDDSTPAEHAFSSFLYPKTTTDNNWPQIDDNHTHGNGQRKGPNLGCGTPITPLTGSRATIQAGLDAMRSWRRGGTTGNLGLAWGWRTISPKWRGLWGNADLPLDYGTDYMDKVVVILTDGNNEFYNLPNGEGGDPSTPSDFTAYGRVNAPGPVGLGSSVAGGVGILNTRMTAICTAMKAQRIKIYTIIFGTSANATTRALYQSCATSPAMYYWAVDNTEIGDVFRSIGGQLANLLIVE